MLSSFLSSPFSFSPMASEELAVLSPDFHFFPCVDFASPQDTMSKRPLVKGEGSVMTNSPITSAKKSKSHMSREAAKAAEKGGSVRSLDSELANAVPPPSPSFTVRARNLFSPVFKPVMSLFQSPKKDLGQVSEERDGSPHGEQEFADADEAPHAKLDSGEETAKSDGTALEDSTGDGESDADFEDDYDEFDPFEFIKNLPENPSKDSLSMVLPKKTRGQPPVSLVLDLDETLVHASLEFMENAHLTFNVNFHDQEFTVWVKIRPHCHEFLEAIKDKFELIVFTASQKIYADKLLNLLDPNKEFIKHRVFRDSCVLVNENYVKDLTVLGRDLSKVAIVDNSPQAFGYQLANGIPIKSWFGDTEDRCLAKLLPFIDSLSDVDDVRPHIQNKYKLHERVAASSSS